MQQHIEQILSDMDTLRPFVLANQQQNAELRSIMRRIIQHVEFIQSMPSINPKQYEAIISFIIPLLDAEHGALLKRGPEDLLSDEEIAQLTQHIQVRRNMLQTIQYDWPILQHFLKSSYDLLGKKASSPEQVSNSARELERHLRDHLHHDSQLHKEVAQLIAALNSSMEGIVNLLQEVGEDAPEIKRAQNILNRELPTDPSQAQSLLQQAREGLIQAANKLTTAGRTMHHHIKQQQSQMISLTEHLKIAEAEARNDPLTGLANRRKLAEFLSSVAADMPISFIMVDIDHFKQINDRYGHESGDDILSALAALLNEATRSTDMVARLGGEEFCIVLPGAELNAASALASNLCQSVSLHEFTSNTQHISVTISLGVSQKHATETAMESIKRADQGLYQSKENGRNRVTLMN